MLSVLRRAPVVVLCLVLVGKPTVLAQAPAKGTEILWDRYGIPHIFAPDHPSLFYAYGYAQMEAHTELLLRLYAQARGRGAEFYGEPTTWTPIDGCEPTASLTRAKKWAAGQSPEFGPLIESFVRGLNAWAAEHKADLSAGGAAACCRSASKTSTRTACGSSTTTGSSIRQSCLRDWRAPTSRPTAPTSGPSPPSRSASGKAMLMSNSHLQWGDIHTYFEVQLTAPGVTSYGAVWVGFPVLRQCFTEYLGWTQTTNNPAESDLYRLMLKDGGYVLDGQVRPFETHTETIKVREANGSLRDVPLDSPSQRARTGRSRSRRYRQSRCAWPPSIVRGSSSSSGAWGWPRTSANGKTRCACSNCRCSTPRTPTATVTSPTSTTRRCRAHTTGDYRFWQGVVPGDQSDLIATTIQPYDADPQGDRPADGLGAELQRHAVDLGVSDDARLRRSSPPASPRPRASRSARSAASAS